MDTEYLPGDVRERIIDLMKERKITQAQLAEVIGTTDSTLSRFLTGKTDKLSNENIIRIAKTFNVSTDFLLGIINVPDRDLFEISELGLSVQAARNLYTGKVNADVVNRLLESSCFAELTYIIDQYFDDTLASGFAAQNQMITTIKGMLSRTVKTEASKQVARDINTVKTPVYQADLTQIQNQFLLAIKEVKKEIDSDLRAFQILTKDITANVFSEVTKGKDMQNLRVMPEDISAAVIGSIAGMDGVNQEGLDKFGESFTDFLNSTLQPKEQPENNDEEPKQ